MKTILFPLLLFCFLTVFGRAQTLNGCFDEYNSLFRNRGAKRVLNGERKIVIATKRNGVSNCFMGKVAVNNDEIVPPLYIEKDDGSFVEFKMELTPAFQSVIPLKSRAIEDGTSVTFRTTDDELVKVFFITFLDDKPKTNKQAPSANSFLK